MHHTIHTYEHSPNLKECANKGEEIATRALGTHRFLLQERRNCERTVGCSDVCLKSMSIYRYLVQP